MFFLINHRSHSTSCGPVVFHRMIDWTHVLLTHAPHLMVVGIVVLLAMIVQQVVHELGLQDVEWTMDTVRTVATEVQTLYFARNVCTFDDGLNLKCGSKYLHNFLLASCINLAETLYSRKQINGNCTLETMILSSKILFINFEKSSLICIFSKRPLGQNLWLYARRSHVYFVGGVFFEIIF